MAFDECVGIQERTSTKTVDIYCHHVRIFLSYTTNIQHKIIIIINNEILCIIINNNNSIVYYYLLLIDEIIIYYY